MHKCPLGTKTLHVDAQISAGYQNPPRWGTKSVLISTGYLCLNVEGFDTRENMLVSLHGLQSGREECAFCFGKESIILQQNNESYYFSSNVFLKKHFWCLNVEDFGTQRIFVHQRGGFWYPGDTCASTWRVIIPWGTILVPFDVSRIKRFVKYTYLQPQFWQIQKKNKYL